MAQTSRLVLEIDSRDAEQKAADTRRALEALETAGIRVKPAMDKAGKGMDGAGKSAEKSAKSFSTEREEIEALLGRIDPLSKKLGDLDRQEQELARHRKAGTIDLDTFNEYQSKINNTRNDLSRFNDSLTRTGNTAKQTAAALRGVPAQFTDIAVSLQGGQAPLTVFLQQGGQLKDMFGGIAPAAKALGGYIVGLINPFTVLATSAVALGAVFYDAEKQISAFNKALFSGSASSGQTASTLAVIAKNAAALTGDISEANDAVIALAGSSRLSQVQFVNLAEAAAAIGAFSGKSAGEVAKSLGDMGDSATKAAEKISAQYGLLTAAQYEAITALDQQGRKQEALDSLSAALNENAQKRLKQYKESLSEIERQWDAIGTSISRAYNSLKGELFPDLNKQIEIVERILQARKDGGVTGAISGAFGFGDNSTSSLEAQLKVLQQRRDIAASTAKAEGEAISKEQARIEADSKWNSLAKKELGDQAKLAKDIADARKLGVEAGKSQAEIDKVVADIQAKFDKSQAKPKAYTENAGMKALDQARQQYAVLQQQNALIGVQKGEVDKLGASGQALVKWEQELADIKGKQTLTADQKSLLANQELITAQLKKNAALERENQLRKIATEETQKLAAFQSNLASQLANAQTGLDNNLAGMGLGDQARQRLQEQLSIQQQYQSQLDGLVQQRNEGRISESLYSKETEALRAALQARLAMQHQYYTEVDKAQSDWSLGASSAFQTYAEKAADVAGQTRNLFTNAFSNMEDGIVQFVKTGKLSFKDLADGIVADLVRIQVRKAAAGIFSSIAGAGIGGLFSSGGYTGDGGKYEPKGVVHGGEFVVRKEVVSQPGAREFLERMNSNTKGYADGGYVGATAAASAVPSSSSATPNFSSMPPIVNQVTINGNPTQDDLDRMETAIQRGAERGYQMVLRDFKMNGPARQMVKR